MDKHVGSRPAGDGRRPGPLRTRVRLVVSRSVYVRDAVWGDALLRRVSRRNLREDYEPQGSSDAFGREHFLFGVRLGSPSWPMLFLNVGAVASFTTPSTLRSFVSSRDRRSWSQIFIFRMFFWFWNNFDCRIASISRRTWAVKCLTTPKTWCDTSFALPNSASARMALRTSRRVVFCYTFRKWDLTREETV